MRPLAAARAPHLALSMTSGTWLSWPALSVRPAAAPGSISRGFLFLGTTNGKSASKTESKIMSTGMRAQAAFFMVLALCLALTGCGSQPAPVLEVSQLGSVDSLEISHLALDGETLLVPEVITMSVLVNGKPDRVEFRGRHRSGGEVVLANAAPESPGDDVGHWSAMAHLGNTGDILEVWAEAHFSTGTQASPIVKVSVASPATEDAVRHMAASYGVPLFPSFPWHYQSSPGLDKELAAWLGDGYRDTLAFFVSDPVPEVNAHQVQAWYTRNLIRNGWWDPAMAGGRSHWGICATGEGREIIVYFSKDFAPQQASGERLCRMAVSVVKGSVQQDLDIQKGAEALAADFVVTRLGREPQKARDYLHSDLQDMPVAMPGGGLQLAGYVIRTLQAREGAAEVLVSLSYCEPPQPVYLGVTERLRVERSPSGLIIAQWEPLWSKVEVYEEKGTLRIHHEGQQEMTPRSLSLADLSGDGPEPRAFGAVAASWDGTWIAVTTEGPGAILGVCKPAGDVRTLGVFGDSSVRSLHWSNRDFLAVTVEGPRGNRWVEIYHPMLPEPLDMGLPARLPAGVTSISVIGWSPVSGHLRLEVTVADGQLEEWRLAVPQGDLTGPIRPEPGQAW